ncbi:MAG: hypothetical protein U0R72_02975 [Nakamurella multipartita]
MPPRTRAVPRPAPIVHQDMFTDAALHDSPKRNGKGRAKKGPAKAATANPPPAPPADAPAPALGDGGTDLDGLEHPVTAPRPGRRPAAWA